MPVKPAVKWHLENAVARGRYSVWVSTTSRLMEMVPDKAASGPNDTEPMEDVVESTAAGTWDLHETGKASSRLVLS